MQATIIIGLLLALGAVVNATLLGLVVIKQRKFDRQTNGGQLVADLRAFDDCQTPEEQTAALIATCEHFRRAQMMWINEAAEAKDAHNLERQHRAEELARAWGEVYVLSCAFYRRWEIRS